MSSTVRALPANVRNGWKADIALLDGNRHYDHVKITEEFANERTGLSARRVGSKVILCKLALVALLALLWCLVWYETGLLHLGGPLNRIADALSLIVWLLVPSVIGFIKARHRLLEVIACVASFYIVAFALGLGAWRDGI